ncbi:hypothetical protein Rrhod_4221 [Rhodococcus rhodnii LMG 5362]|uniref:Uncharacterized protein n=1 Tax=Rhodococcus rhodnii LMG 5362 TaxID=1273125 RepID=R7WK97_9NOCA|nr:hypothetical protein Rrhod_4221 [Rhodococcus rhodnii LMG 5362]
MRTPNRLVRDTTLLNEKTTTFCSRHTDSKMTDVRDAGHKNVRGLTGTTVSDVGRT